MISLKNADGSDKLTAVADGDITTGKWVVVTEFNSNRERVVSAVDSYASGQLDASELYLAVPSYYKSEDIADYQVSSDKIADGKRCIIINADGVVVEDDQLYNAGGTTTAEWDAASPGDALVLSTSGYPALDGGSGDPGASATIIGYFEHLDNEVIFYRISK